MRYKLKVMMFLRFLKRQNIKEINFERMARLFAEREKITEQRAKLILRQILQMYENCSTVRKDLRYELIYFDNRLVAFRFLS